MNAIGDSLLLICVTGSTVIGITTAGFMPSSAEEGLVILATMLGAAILAFPWDWAYRSHQKPQKEIENFLKK